MRSSERLTVPITLSRNAGRPLRDQLVDAIRHAIDTGALPPGARLPSTRTLAQSLGVSRNVAVEAYQHLFAADVIHSAHGSGTYVTQREAKVTVLAPRTTPAFVDLRPGQACVEDFPLAAWRSAWRQASHTPPPPGPPPALGLPGLRAALSDHLRRVHGVAITDHDVVITSGVRHAQDLLRRALGPAHTAIMIGSLGEILTPAIGLGYLVLPHSHTTPVAAEIEANQEQPSVLNQRVAAELFRTGQVARRITRIANIHRRKFELVRETLEPLAADVVRTGHSGTATLLPHEDIPVSHLIEACRHAGVLIDQSPAGAELGFAHLDDTALRAALHTIVRTGLAVTRQAAIA